MSELKLTIDQLKNYLGTGVKVMDGYGDIIGLENMIVGSYRVISGIKPIVYRLSDLDKEIEVNGERFVPLDELPNIIEGWCDAYEEYFNIGFDGTSLDGCPFEVVQKLLEWNFWISGDIYFSERLVINKMKVK